MSKVFLLLLNCSGCMFLASCSLEKKYTCPIPSGEIVFLQSKGAEIAKPSSIVTIIGGADVYSSSKGMVKDVEAVEGKKRVYVDAGSLVFIYDNLSECVVEKGQVLSKGKQLGKISEGDVLYLSIIKGGVFITPQKILKCKTVESYNE